RGPDDPGAGPRALLVDGAPRLALPAPADPLGRAPPALGAAVPRLLRPLGHWPLPPRTTRTARGGPAGRGARPARCDGDDGTVPCRTDRFAGRGGPVRATAASGGRWG